MVKFRIWVLAGGSRSQRVGLWRDYSALAPCNFFLCFWKPWYQLFGSAMPSHHDGWNHEQHKTFFLFDCFCQVFCGGDVVLTNTYRASSCLTLIDSLKYTKHAFGEKGQQVSPHLLTPSPANSLPCWCLKPGEKVLGQEKISPEGRCHQLMTEMNEVRGQVAR